MATQQGAEMSHFLSILFIILGVFNEACGMLSFFEATGVIQQIAGICLIILGTLQFILAKMLWKD